MKNAKKLFLIGSILLLSCSFLHNKKKGKKETSLNEEFKILQSLGYKLNDFITKDELLADIKEFTQEQKSYDSTYSEKTFQRLYFFLGWRKGYPRKNYTNNCIWYDLEFIDSSEDYIWFMNRMSVISNNELIFEDINIVRNDDNYESIVFKVNSIQKKWKLEKSGYISDTFFKRFAFLNEEFNTKGKYTYYTDGSQQFVIDYATDKEQKDFIKKTNLNREWLFETKAFKNPTD